MQNKNHYPALKILLALVTGILLGLSPLLYYNLSFIQFVIIICILSTISWYANRYQTYRTRWVRGFVISIVFIIIGYFITISNFENKKPDYFGNYISSHKDIAIIDITEAVQIKSRNVRATADIKYFKTKEHFIRTTGKAIIYFKRDSITERLRYGDRLMLNAKFKEISAPLIPAAVNYKRYFAFKNIYHQTYVSSENLSIIVRNHINTLYYYAYKIRDRFINILEENNIKGKELAVGAALLFGYRENLDAETIREYSNAGVMHILCVSGLNVGILYIVLCNLLFFMDKQRKWKIFKFIIILLSIWFYTFVCGLSPSILRASAMFTFLLIGKIFNKEPDIFNALIVSAFALLLFDPFLIADIGFQLSYASVAGIILLCPYLEKLLNSQNILITKIWGLISMSIAAQIAVFPLVLYYFHFFPLLFIIANIIIIPLVFIITYAGCMLLFINPFIISIIAAKIFTVLIRFINYTVWSIEQTAFSTLNNININVLQVILIYLLIITLSISIINRNKRILFVSLIMTFTLALTISLNQLMN